LPPKKTLIAQGGRQVAGGYVGDRYMGLPENTQSPCKPLSGYILGLNIPTIFPGIP